MCCGYELSTVHLHSKFALHHKCYTTAQWGLGLTDIKSLKSKPQSICCISTKGSSLVIVSLFRISREDKVQVECFLFMSELLYSSSLVINFFIWEITPVIWAPSLWLPLMQLTSQSWDQTDLSDQVCEVDMTCSFIERTQWQTKYMTENKTISHVYAY